MKKTLTITLLTVCAVFSFAWLVMAKNAEHNPESSLPDDAANKAVQNTDRTVQEIKEMAQSGNAEAQFTLANFYHFGIFLEPDYRMAYQLYGAAAIKSSSPAYNNLGILYAQGKGVKKDLKQAKEFFQHVEKRDFSLAKINLELLEEQKGYPALLAAHPEGFSITCEKYDEQTIDNFIATMKKVNWKEINFRDPPSYDQIPENLLPYAAQQAKAAGIRVIEE